VIEGQTARIYVILCLASRHNLGGQLVTSAILDERPTLADEARSRARARIVQAAMSELAARGVDVTVDEIATSAGVSRRTVFRHFATHGQLLATASAEIWRSFEGKLPEPPNPGEDLDAWLTKAAVSIHELNTKILGQAFWGLNAPESNEHAELSEWRTELMSRRVRTINQFTAVAWVSAGGKGEPPAWVVDAFALLLSSFASNGLSVGGVRPPEDTGRVCARILLAVLAAALGRRPPRTVSVRTIKPR
jgi:AcrR family transcriptional regulator